MIVRLKKLVSIGSDNKIDTEEKLLSGFIPAGAFIFYKSQRTFIRKVIIRERIFVMNF